MTYQLSRLFALLLPFLLLGGCGDGDAEPGATAIADDKVSLDAPPPDAVDETGAAIGNLQFGDPEAPVQLIEFAAYSCPACASFHRAAYDRLKETFTDTGRIHMIQRDYPLSGVDLGISSVARCQGPERFALITDHLFRNQPRWRQQPLIDNLAMVMREVGMSRAELDRCLQNRDLQAMLAERAKEEADRFNIGYTPFFLINGEEFKLQAGEDPFTQLQRALEEAGA